MANWTPKDYTPFFLFDEPTHTEREIRAEYTRLRDISHKRAMRLEKAGLTAQAEYLREMFPTLKDMTSLIQKIVEENKRLPAKKQKKVPSVGDFLARGKGILDQAATSLAGIRQIQRSIFSETGELVPLGKVYEFDQYMRSWRLSAYSKLMVASSDAVDLYKSEDYQEIGGSFPEFYALFLEET